MSEPGKFEPQANQSTVESMLDATPRKESSVTVVTKSEHPRTEFFGDREGSDSKQYTLIEHNKLTFNADILKCNDRDSIFKITPFPDCITEICLRGTHCVTIPTGIELCVNLVAAYFNDNQITQIPSSILQLRKLETLDFSRNEIVNVSPFIGYLPELKSLSLASNPVVLLPMSLVNLKNLQHLDLCGVRTMVVPTQRICDQGLTSILEELKTLLATRFDTNNDRKTGGDVFNPSSTCNVCRSSFTSSHEFNIHDCYQVYDFELVLRPLSDI